MSSSTRDSIPKQQNVDTHVVYDEMSQQENHGQIVIHVVLVGMPYWHMVQLNIPDPMELLFYTWPARERDIQGFLFQGTIHPVCGVALLRPRKVLLILS